MSFLVWNNQQHAVDSLDAINTVYECPYEDENDYKMDQWDVSIKSQVNDDYGFYSPETRLGHDESYMMTMLTPGYVEYEEIPDEFLPPEEVV